VIVTLWLVRHPTCLKILRCAAGNISGSVIGKENSVFKNADVSIKNSHMDSSIIKIRYISEK